MHANQGLIDQLDVVAKRHAATLAQIALAWLLSRHPSIVPISGARSLLLLEANLGSADIQLR